MAIDHCLLHGMQGAVLPQVLDSQELAGVKHADELDTGVHRAIGEAAVERSRNNDSTSAAIALVATFLDAGTPAVDPQPVKDGHCRIEASNLLQIIPEEKSN
jgi:hypothetical protein